MKYDNERDSGSYGSFDAGNIIDGIAQFDEDTGEYVVVDDEGMAFSIQTLLKKLSGKKVRLTCISFESIQNIENMLRQTTEPQN